VKNIFINKIILFLAILLYWQSAHASEWPVAYMDEKSVQANKEYYLCSESHYSNSKFDYKNHYITSLKFVFPKSICLRKDSRSFDEEVQILRN